ncbi:F-box-like domain superfamily [Arabidopsis thaliana x Arabidopsis arenosa]|uniref:F-box-like domain superfamily n=1 Tax=Arabidopsis thaliana x Arabidopsis arenosa TaxID=1240361 RepID=A0A8T2AU32_9BRAS|nr:F-box-like domain superfamily [Arabidopsis thaliana x Arabidopsis arenosa]
MASGKLPWELEEEILSRLPPRSLVRFRSVCKHWNSLFKDKRFVKKHLSRARPQFIILTESKKMYSIDIDMGGTIEVRELSYDFHCQPMKTKFTTIMACDGLLFREFWKQGVAVWNPWLRQVGWIEYKDKYFHICGVGYDSCRPEKGYKILGYIICIRRVSDSLQEGYDKVAIYECASQALKFIDTPFNHWPTKDPLSVNGNLYWLAQNRETLEYFIQTFDFSMEIFKPFCLLPCRKDYCSNELVLTVFKDDRFSLLNQSFETRKIEIWVSKMKIDREEEVVWIKLMTLPTTNLPKLDYKYCGISYFIFEETLIMCCGDDETGAACIYMVRGDMFKKIQIDSGIVRFSQCVYLPNLLSVPFVSHQV